MTVPVYYIATDFPEKLFLYYLDFKRNSTKGLKQRHKAKKKAIASSNRNDLALKDGRRCKLH